MKKTKIVCTIGPASESEEILEQLMEAGMNVARLNFSHGDHDEHLTRIERIRSISKKVGIKILGNGELSHSLNVKAHKFTQSAKEAIENAGGTAEVI